MSKITGWDQIETGGTDPSYYPKGNSASVARLIEIVLELKQLVSIFDPESITQFQELTDVVTSHINDSNVHLTTSLKFDIVSMISAWEAGDLGGGGGGATVYATRAALLATTGVVGSIAIVQTEPTNLYIWNPAANRWTIKDGNMYNTTNDIPDDVAFYIPNGTVLIITSTGERFIWKV